MDASNPTALASIVVPCFNQVKFTQLCVPALFRHTRRPWELIVVDNGSTDDTAVYLAGVRDAASVPVTIVKNARNRGFPAAINQGLRRAQGEYLVLLNNDAVVTDGWLDQLIALTDVRLDESMPVLEGGGAENGGAENGDRHPAGSIPAPVSAIGGPGASPHFPPPRVDRAQPIPLLTPHSSLATPTIGLVGPMSNYATPPQLVEKVPYRDLDEMHAFAGRWRDEHRGRWFKVPKLSGFCVLARRAVYEAIGGLDERFGLGFFDDDDLAERARRAGFSLAVAHDLFIHHFGSRTFVGNGIDAEGLLEENARRFADKWGHDTPRGRKVALRAWSDPPGFLDESQRAFARQVDDGMETAESLVEAPRHRAGEVPRPRRNGSSSRARKVGLTMIVRDEEENLPHCLESVRGIFDEIVVVDTGSTDRTREIARGFRAQVYDFAWIDDFAAARNEALSHATGDFAFWLDADDVVDPPEREKLRALLDGLASEDEAAYVVRCACDPGRDGSGGETVVDHVRLFPLRDDLRWTYRVHEQIMPALRRSGIRIRWTDLIVRHTGYVDLPLRARKLDRDLRILEEELKARPDEPFILFNLGAIAIERRDWRGALDYLRKSLARSAPGDSITRKLFALIARSHQMMGETAEALRTCSEGLSLDAQDAELLFRKGVVHRQRGESAEAESSWRQILGLRRPEHFASLDVGIYGHLPRRNLAMLAVERGDHAESARLWREVLAECPGDREALAKLGQPERLPVA